LKEKKLIKLKNVNSSKLNTNIKSDIILPSLPSVRGKLALPTAEGDRNGNREPNGSKSVDLLKKMGQTYIRLYSQIEQEVRSIRNDKAGSNLEGAEGVNSVGTLPEVKTRRRGRLQCQSN
jgi:hypothetical protein